MILFFVRVNVFYFVLFFFFAIGICETTAKTREIRQEKKISEELIRNYAKVIFLGHLFLSILQIIDKEA